MASNDAGDSDASSTLSVTAASTPAAMDAPVYVTSSCASRSVQISWTPPADTGGCPLKYFTIYRDDLDGTGATLIHTTTVSTTTVP